MADIVIVSLIIAYCIFLYVRHRIKKKNGTAGSCTGCCCNCSGCAACCGGVPWNEIYKEKQEDADG